MQDSARVRHGSWICISLGLLVSSLAFGSGGEAPEPSVPAKNGFWVRSRIQRNSARMSELGVRIEFWRPVLKTAFLKRLKREPTPAEYEFQQEQLGLLLSEVVTHTEIDEDGNWSTLPPEADDHKLVRISGFDAIDLRKNRFEIPEPFQGKFLCVDGYCFVPRLFSLQSELIFRPKQYVLFNRTCSSGTRKKKPGSAVRACAVFRGRSRRPWVVNVPLPRVRHEAIRLLQVSIKDGSVTIKSKALAQVHFEED